MSSPVQRRERSASSVPDVDRILLIDGDNDAAKLVASAIRGAREFALQRSTTLAEGLEQLRSAQIRLVLAAAELPDSRGAATVQALRKVQPDVPILVLGDISQPEAVRIAAAGAQACLQRKALTQTTLQRALSRALTQESRVSVDRNVATKPVSRLAVSLMVGSLRVANDGSVRSANPAITRMLGYQVTNELVGQPLAPLLVRAQDWIALRDGTASVETVSLALRHQGGASLYTKGEVHRRRDIQGRPVGMDLLLVDFTTQHQLEQALESASHAEALAALTAGLAHDFNNLLTVIVGNLYLLAESVRSNDALLGKVKIARDAARRGADLTKQLLTFARQKNAEREVAGVQKVMENIVLLLERALGSKIKLTTEVSSDAWPVSVDVTQLESAVINLAVNARDALEGGGNVTITARNTALDAIAAEALSVPPGDYVAIAVADDGPGIPAEIRSRIFDPFFTTKGQRGTGLGLGMVRRMVVAAGGAVDVDSELGRGTTFTLLLPRAKGEKTHNNELTQPLSTLPTGSEAVVVCCSDAQVAQTIHELLVVLGYRVSLAPSLEAVPAKLAERADLLICEPASSERDAIQQMIGAAHQSVPDLKVLLVADDTWNAEQPDSGVHGLLRKPFSLADLAKAVRAALNC